MLQLAWTSEIMMLGERSQSQKIPYYMTPFIGNVQNRQVSKEKNEVKLGLE